MKKVATIFTLIMCCYSLFGQITNSVIIKTNDQFVSSNLNFLQKLDNTISIREISKSLNLTIIESSNTLDLTEIKIGKGIVDAWYDANVSMRATTPNDELFAQQWGITLSKIDDAWDFTTGGLSEDGKEIVIAVVDDGFDIEHEDFDDIFYVNEGEIPGNGIDDDANGYEDDYLGLNIVSKNDQHPVNTHGTSVIGILGASGDNDIGIAGVNWKVKVLPISNAKTVGAIIESYEYILNIRKKYNETNGAEGAYIVVTSFSGGIEDVFPTGIYNEWCTLYDHLGEQGVLSIGATANKFVDVDVVGDIPTTCASEYFIGVTSLRRGGEVDEEAAFGTVSVDLAAPGDGILTTDKSNEYNVFGGTSAATPMVAGVTALLYSAPCASLSTLVQMNPSEAAKFIKRIMIEGVTKSDDMQNLYLSSGYLNAVRSLKKMVDLCDGDLIIPNEKGALRITETRIVDQELEVYYVTPNNNQHFIRLSDPLGRVISYEEFIPKEFGERVLRIAIDESIKGTIYLSIGNKKFTASKGYFFKK